MVQTRKERKKAVSAASANLKLAQPDRSGPSQQTLLDLAQDRGLCEQADLRRGTLEENNHDRDRKAGLDGGDWADRIMETLLWSISLTMLHFTFDVLVQNQYAVAISWPRTGSRALQAFLVFSLLFYVLHPHPSSPDLLPGLPARYQTPLRQAIFFTASAVSGCYLIHISSNYGYLAVMKQSPPLGCLWVWSVMELDLTPAVLSLACTLGFYFYGGYTIF